MIVCPLCTTAPAPHFKLRTGDYPVYRCGSCGLQFLSPQPDDKTLGEIYSAHYFLGDDTPESEARVLALKRGTAALYLDQLQRELPMKSPKLLELGCGRGEFLMEAQSRGFDVYGVEYSPHATESANQRLGARRVEAGTIESSRLPDDTFDVCTFADVVEHVRDPLKFLNAVHRVMKPGGLVYIVTPSLNSWSAKLLGKRWMEYKVEHLSYFGTKSITKALERAGFENVRVQKNPKVLSFDYIAHHFKRFRVPVWSGIVGCLRAVTPGFIAHRQIRIVASGMVVLARKHS